MEKKQIVYEDEVSLRDLILKVREYGLESFRYWYIPAIFAILVAGYQLYRYFNYTPIYPATITFSVDEDEGGGSSGLTSILGQFGLGGVRPTRYNLDKILELSKSRRVVQQTLFTKITLDRKEDFLANHLIRIYKHFLANHLIRIYKLNSGEKKGGGMNLHFILLTTVCPRLTVVKMRFFSCCTTSS